MSGGLGEFNVSMGKPSEDLEPREAVAKPILVPGGIPAGAAIHYVIILPQKWSQPAPLKFNNAELEEFRARLHITTEVTLPEMPGFFPIHPVGKMDFSGRHVTRLDSALKDQPLFSHLEGLRELVHKCANRRITFPEFILSLDKLALPVEWRNDIVNGLYDHAQPAEHPKLETRSKLSSDLDHIMDLFQTPDSGGTAVNPHLGKFLEEVGKESTGFILRDAAAKELEGTLARTLATLRGGVLRDPCLSSVLGFLSALQKLSRLAKGRDRQTIHLWSQIPTDPMAILTGDRDGAIPDITPAIVLLDPEARQADFLVSLANLAERLGSTLLVQSSDESQSMQARQVFQASLPTRAYLFAGGVATQVQEDNQVFRPAVLAFLEGLVSARETVEFYQHRVMILRDQDVLTEKGQARATDLLLDNAEWEAWTRRRINRVNGVRNRAEATFPLLVPLGGA